MRPDRPTSTASSDVSGLAPLRHPEATPRSGIGSPAAPGPGNGDPLRQVLATVRLTGAVFLDMEIAPDTVYLTAPGRRVADILMPAADHVIPYHLITEGACRAGLVGGETVDLTAGDLVVFPGGEQHLLGTYGESWTRGAAIEISGESLGRFLRPGAIAAMKHPDGGYSARIVCGFLSCDARVAELLVAGLPAIVRISPKDADAEAWVRSSLRYAVSQSLAARPNTSTVVARLAELLFVEAIRTYSESSAAEQRAPFAALRDPQIGRALALMHAQPGHAWTLEELARRAGISRSALGQRFTSLVGVPPIQYLARWRAAVAAARLRDTNAPVIRVAMDVGYESEAAFNRAFKREYGLPPAAWRKRHLREGPSTPET